MGIFKLVGDKVSLGKISCRHACRSQVPVFIFGLRILFTERTCGEVCLDFQKIMGVFAFRGHFGDIQ